MDEKEIKSWEMINGIIDTIDYERIKGIRNKNQNLADHKARMAYREMEKII